MKYAMCVALVVVLVSCGPAPGSWGGTPNPLDGPENMRRPSPEYIKSAGWSAPHAAPWETGGVL